MSESKKQQKQPPKHVTVIKKKSILSHVLLGGCTLFFAITATASTLFYLEAKKIYANIQSRDSEALIDYLNESYEQGWINALFEGASTPAQESALDEIAPEPVESQDQQTPEGE